MNNKYDGDVDDEKNKKANDNRSDAGGALALQSCQRQSLWKNDRIEEEEELLSSRCTRNNQQHVMILIHHREMLRDCGDAT
jgi:hypothetical protein